MIEPVSRRFFIKGLAALVAAPAIIRVTTLMPISVQPPLVLTHTMDDKAFTYRWVTDGPGKRERLEAAGYTFIPEGTVLLNDAGLPSTTWAAGPVRTYDDGRRFMQLVYIPNEEYARRQMEKEAHINAIERNLDFRPAGKVDAYLGNSFYVPSADRAKWRDA